MSRPSVCVFSVVQGDAEFTHPYTVISRVWGATEFIEGSYSGVSSPNSKSMFMNKPPFALSVFSKCSEYRVQWHFNYRLKQLLIWYLLAAADHRPDRTCRTCWGRREKRARTGCCCCCCCCALAKTRLPKDSCVTPRWGKNICLLFKWSLSPASAQCWISVQTVSAQSPAWPRRGALNTAASTLHHWQLPQGRWCRKNDSGSLHPRLLLLFDPL